MVGATNARCSSERVKRAASLRGGSAAISIASEPCTAALRFAICGMSFFCVVVVVATLRHQKNGTPPRKRGLFLFSRLAR